MDGSNTLRGGFGRGIRYNQAVPETQPINLLLCEASRQKMLTIHSEKLAKLLEALWR